MGLFSGILGAVAGPLVGGLFNKKATDDANEANSPAAQVAGWEAAGINPLFGISKGQAIPQQANTAIGDAFLNAGGAVGGLLDRANQLTIEKTRQAEITKRQANEIKRLEKAQIPTNTQRYGSILPRDNPVNVVANQNSSISLRPRSSTLRNGIGSTTAVAPDREFEKLPYSSGSGLTEISNAVTNTLGGPIVVPGDDGEPWGIDELATAVIVGTPQVVYNFPQTRSYSTHLERRDKYLSRNPNERNVESFVKRVGRASARRPPTYRMGTDPQITYK